MFIRVEKSSFLQRSGAARLHAALAEQGVRSCIVDRSERVDGDCVEVRTVRPAGEMPIGEEGFSIAGNGRSRVISAIDGNGALYGLFDLAEQIEMHGGFAGAGDKVCNPRFRFRAVKYNLPWHSYRENEALRANAMLSRDLGMWESLLDLMMESRLNALTLWNLHPFAYMVRAESFPRACPFSEVELGEWRKFWARLFGMAKERGIETYVFNWNIIVSPAFIEHYGEGNADLWADGHTSPQIEEYMRESVAQLIEEYPDLTGLGVTPGEAMQGWDGGQMAGWFERTFFRAIREASRPVKLIYRASLHGDHRPHRDAIDNSGIATPENPILVELKFNWSHPHSTTTLVRAHGGRSGEEYWSDPAPSRHKMAWMIRNEDFFRLRWGDPDFIREHIASNGHDYVAGYFIGSECYIPACDLFTRPERVRWNYDFERKWLYYQQWGRLLYDPGTCDAVFAHSFNRRYGVQSGEELVEAYRLSTRTARRVAQFFEHTWDHSFYTEGLIGVKREFITLQEFIDSTPIEPNFLGVREYGDGKQDFGTKTTPLKLAAELETINSTAIELVKQIRNVDGGLANEIDDVLAWAHLGLYFSSKVRAAVAVNQQRRDDAVAHIRQARHHWHELVAVTEQHYQPSYLSIIERSFHWKDFLGNVDDEVAWVKDRERPKKTR